MGYPQHRQLFPSARANQEATNGQAGLQLVAGVAGTRIVVDNLVVSMNAAGNFNLDDGTTQIFGAVYLPINGNFSHFMDLQVSRGADLNYDSTITGEQTIYVEYHFEG